ncbi:MAG: hypothetical protein M3304_07530 [Actinomycetota bacterium]|nr:hypothetical protein [Actinomycetota bacterium]
MGSHTSKRVGLFAAALFAALVLVSGASAARIDTAFLQYPGTAFEGGQASAGFGRVRAAGATFIKLTLDWRSIVRRGQPADAKDPADPTYDWSRFDMLILQAVQNGLRPLVMVVHAPPYASTVNDGWANVDPDALGEFAFAAARRYNGNYFDPAYAEPLPPVRYWQAWNEPNLFYYLSPQYKSGTIVSADRYRVMANRFTAAVKAVNRSNLVLAGGTGPFKRVENSSPLAFMREFLCLRRNLTRKPRCGPVHFDIWGHHPYTSGGPKHTAILADDVSLGDLPQMRRVLKAARRRGTIVSTGPVRFWVDEFSWDSRPPDPGAIPAALHARWVAESLYRMWRNGVSLVAWLQLMDNRFTGRCGNPYQSGFYQWAPTIESARPKHSLAAFRFPFVAFRQRGRVLVWGRTPASTPGRVVVERKVRRRWVRVGTLRTGSGGVFTHRYRIPRSTSSLRARFHSTRALPFSLKRVPDRFFNPFGVRPINCNHRVADQRP